MNYEQLFAYYDEQTSLDGLRPEIDAMRFAFPSKEQFQVRIHREYKFIENTFQDYIDNSVISFGFEHEADDEVSRTHVHHYFFGLKRTRQTIDAYCRRYYSTNSEFSVSQTCGKKKRPLDVRGAWIYGTTEKLLEPKWTRGLSEDELMWLRMEAIDFWNKIKESAQTKTAVQVVEVVIEKDKKDNIWTDYYEKVFLEWRKGEESKFKNFTLDMFKRWITADYLNKGKAPPRVADRNRYAYGLYVLNKHGFRDDVEYYNLTAEY